MQVPKAPWTSQEEVHIKHGISVPAAIWSTSPRREAAGSPCPCKGCHRVTREGLQHCHLCLGNEPDPGSWPGAGGLETPPPSRLTRWHALQPGPQGPSFFFSCLPCSQSSAYYRSRRFGQRPLCTHSAGAHEVLRDSVSPLSPWQSHDFPEIPLHLPSQGESLDLAGGTALFLRIRNHPSILTFLSVRVFFFQPPLLRRVSSFG